MQILVVVRHSQQIAFASKVMPVEGYVRVGKAIRNVRHPCPIGKIVCRRTYLCALLVAYIHLCEVAADGEPTTEIVTY